MKNIEQLCQDFQYDLENTEKNMLRRRKLVIKSIIVGILSGLIAVAFRFSLEQAEILRNLALNFFQQTYWFLAPLVFVGLILLTVQGVLKFAPEAGGSGIPHLKGVLKGAFHFRALRILIVKFVGGIVGIGSGLALGREGPTVQMGGAIGFLCSHVLSSNTTERKILTCAGAGAGLAAAFNAPFAGLLFVLEELRQDFDRYRLFDRYSIVATFTATISSNIVCRILLGQSPVFQLKLVSYSEITLVFWCILLGLFLGVWGLFFNVTLMKSLSVLSKFKKLIGIALGILFGIIGLYFPDLLGTGSSLTNRVAMNEFSLQPLVLLFLMRFILSILSYNSGTPGGIFAPLLLLGAMLGTIFWKITTAYQHFDVTIFFVLGMGGLFSAIVRSPLTGIVLILEMTNEFYLLLPLMIVAMTAYGIPEFFLNKPIYEDLLLLEIQRKSNMVLKQSESHV
ncbi:H(+)/Cl(-) exchange transporter ClcA [Candidatus Vecturithrix granuli]|uniref:H(+)/Cl(-) exchange transporter ClcA n=1 Tax=Vecturithrix granuli TaxID=1499967 RepID=A0A081CAJ1_VECG1|nr:H(+)/Cl(-) exchange transporter ClcA [Candidatus Vecturithrix granuli]